VPAHFEADAYAGLRRMVATQKLARERLLDALMRLAGIEGDRVALGALVPAVYRLYDNVAAHDAFYVALAASRGAILLTADAPLARAAAQLGVSVILRSSG